MNIKVCPICKGEVKALPQEYKKDNIVVPDVKIYECQNSDCKHIWLPHSEEEKIHRAVRNTLPESPRLAVDTFVLFITKDLNCEFVLIERKNKPFGWALPGGFVEIGESLENAAVRETFEETNIKLALNKIKQFQCYSKPNRDIRGHTVSCVFYGKSLNDKSELKAKDDAVNIKLFNLFDLNSLPNLAFDHQEIITDFSNFFKDIVKYYYIL